MTKKLTTRQLDILTFIHESIRDNGYPPTVREIGNGVQLASTSTVHGHLNRLAERGYLYRDPTKPRAMELTHTAIQALGIQADHIPMLGTVTAGAPILAVEESTDMFPTPPHLKDYNNDLFMLTIRGDSMINAGILDGDQVIVKKTPTASNGEIVIALTEEDEATCKRFYKEKDHYRLQPENDTMDPIILSHVTILGKVVSLYREHVY
ncbi:transcriptional repressor LexA [Atopobacter phocae]|uniref:transcriptional repressor LexA n=1 Tax=Atopobacter phocae TaxID=136492 RepID=UPI0004708E5D|nr:transcriptional repressor LexA [Atopobacter phocae]